MEIAAFVNDLSVFVILSMQGTSLAGMAVELSYVKDTIMPIAEKTLEKMDKMNLEKITRLIKNCPILQECIIPNVSLIMSDGKFAMDDIPALLDMMTRVYTDVNQMFQDGQPITVTSNDLIEVVGILVKVVLCVLVRDPVQMRLGINLVNSAIAMIKLSIKPKKCFFKLCCA